MPLPADKPAAEWDAPDFAALEVGDVVALEGDAALEAQKRATEGGFRDDMDPDVSKVLQALATQIEGRLKAEDRAARTEEMLRSSSDVDAEKEEVNAEEDVRADEGSSDRPRMMPHDVFASLQPLPWDQRYTKICENEFTNVTRLELGGELPVMYIKDAIACKSSLDTEHAVALNENELAAYAGMERLQGSAIAYLVFAGPLSGFRHVVATVDAGETLASKKVAITPAVADSAISALEAVHDAGFLHGDVALRNIVWDASKGEAALIDFALSSRSSDKAAMGEEMAELQACLESELSKRKNDDAAGAKDGAAEPDSSQREQCGDARGDRGAARLFKV